jgi:hypothetical protein
VVLREVEAEAEAEAEADAATHLAQTWRQPAPSAFRAPSPVRGRKRLPRTQQVLLPAPDWWQRTREEKGGCRLIGQSRAGAAVRCAVWRRHTERCARTPQCWCVADSAEHPEHPAVVCTLRNHSIVRGECELCGVDRTTVQGGQDKVSPPHCTPHSVSPHSVSSPHCDSWAASGLREHAALRVCLRPSASSPAPSAPRMHRPTPATCPCPCPCACRAQRRGGSLARNELRSRDEDWRGGAGEREERDRGGMQQEQTIRNGHTW